MRRVKVDPYAYYIFNALSCEPEIVVDQAYIQLNIQALWSPHMLKKCSLLSQDPGPRHKNVTVIINTSITLMKRLHNFVVSETLLLNS